MILKGMTLTMTASRNIYLSLLTAGHFLCDFYANFLPALLPLVILSMQLSLTETGILVMVFSFASSIVQPFCGYYLDKTGYTFPVLITLPISAFFICTVNYVSSYGVLILFLLVSGLASSIFHPLASAMLAKVTPDRNRGWAMSLFICGGNLGFALGPAIIIYFLVNYSFSCLPYLMIPGFLLTFLYMHFRVHHIAIQTRHTQKSSTAPAWYTSPDIIKLNIVMALRSWPQVVIPTFLPIFLAQQGLTTTQAGNMLTVFLLGGAIGGLIGGYIGDRFDHKTCMVAALVLSIPSTYLFMISEPASLLTWVCLGISGAALQSPLPSSIVWAQTLLPENGAMASGMMFGLSFGLGGLGAALTGHLADSIGLSLAMQLTLLPIIVAILLIFQINPRPAANHPIASLNS
jgi:FSR family fosmidomycin resistance protein-like MFS transporter